MDCSQTNFGVRRPPKQSPHKLLLPFQGSTAFLQTADVAMQRNAIVQCFPVITTATSSHVVRQHSTPRFGNQSYEPTPTCSSGFQVPKLLFLTHDFSHNTGYRVETLLGSLLAPSAHKSNCTPVTTCLLPQFYSSLCKVCSCWQWCTVCRFPTMVGCRSSCVIHRVVGVDDGGVPVVSRDTPCCVVFRQWWAAVRNA